jgi:hypothetical protein
MRHLEPLGAEAHGQIDDGRQAVDVLAMDGGVDGERQAERAHPAGGFQLLGVAIRDSGRCGRRWRACASWIEICTWSRPCPASVSSRSRVSSTAAVMRLE